MASLMERQERRSVEASSMLEQSSLIREFQRVSLATFTLKGEAELWWQSVKKEAGLSMVWSWSMFSNKFDQKYFPDSVREKMVSEFISLEQGALYVAQYEARFIELSHFASNLISTSNMKARKFEMRFHPSLRSRVVPLRLPTFVEMTDQAKIIEADFEEMNKTHDQPLRRQDNRNKRKGGPTQHVRPSKKLVRQGSAIQEP
ncbi:uncharacterized protein LOC131247088 [Magnolia sinica]|uniref:uncharacterized protein LOC131247088 n=1 Tax=Magnolia sinica TaxID=86752 RepID=UPI00265B493D|nr:uncharacterized protein LOC131247088 [Magnolia sinica]